ncbi:MAG: hypothetical protein ABSC95_32785 [Acetobacteraceae bacterium]|jgi:hypothetical protein
MPEYVVVRGRPGAAPPLAVFDPNEQLRRAAAADTAERLTRPAAPPPQSDALIFETLRHERLAAESGEGAARVAAADAERRARETPVIDVATLTRRNHNRAADVLRRVANGTMDSLRADLRTAIAGRDAAATAHRDAEAELTKARQAGVDARTELDGYADLDARQDAAAVTSLRLGNLGTLDPDLSAALAARDAATARLDAAQRAERVLAAAVGETHAALLNASDTVATVAAALVLKQGDAVAAELEEVEQRAARLRSRLQSLNGLWLAAPGAGVLALPGTDRMRRLLTNPPANSLAQADGSTAEALRKHFAGLLTDADTILAGESTNQY